MSTKEFTLQKGFILPILKSLSILGKESSITEIADCITSNNLFIPKDGDLEKIDFNGKTRFINAIQYCIYSLVKQGFIVIVNNNLYKNSEAGLKKLSAEWSSYNQNKFIKKVEILNKNKYIYSNIPPYLCHDGQKKATVYGFTGHENNYVKFLNDFIDFIDLNYPSIEEMVKFLKHNYNIESKNDCLNAINVIRSCSLAKIVGRNLSLTKLGQWYINSYDNIALFRIFACIYTGFEEIFNAVAVHKNISIEKLKQELSSQAFDLTNTEQLDIRLNWLKNMKIIESNNSQLYLTSQALNLAEYLGVIDLQSKPELQTYEETAAAENIDYSNDEEYELDNIIDDLISESFWAEHDLNNEDNLFTDFDILDEGKFNQISNNATSLNKNDTFSKNINLSQQERNFLLNNIDIDNWLLDKTNTGFSEEADTFDIDHPTTDKQLPEEINIPDIKQKSEYSPDISENEIISSKPDKAAVITQIPQNNSSKFDDTQKIDMFIYPEEISNLVNLPNNIISQICSALNMGKHIMLTGPHGSGKTSIAVILAKIAHQKGFNNGYILTSANENWTSLDTIGGLIDVENNTRKIFKEGFILKSIRENKWLIVDEISKCDAYKCFNDFINAFYNHNTILSYIHENYKNIEIISDPLQHAHDINQYIKNKGWRMIATMDTSEKQDINFPLALIRRFAFIEIGVSNYSDLIDKYFLKNNLQNDLLKSKIKNIFSQSGLLKFKDIGASSIHDLIEYISIRSKLMTEDENIQLILAEGLELYILPQLRVLDNKILKEVETYIINLFDGYENIKKSISKAL